MHKTTGVRDPAAAFPLPSTRDDAQERREANGAIAVSAIGLAVTGGVELALAVLTGSVGLTVGRRIKSPTLIADARHSWLDALSSAGALAGLVAVSLGFRLGDPIAGMAVTLFICHVGYEVTKDVVHRLADGVDPAVITAAETAAGSVDGVIHAHARARWTGRTLRVEIECWVDPDLTVSSADALGQQIAQAIASQLPEVGSLTWAPRAAPAR
jgi:cation diffusion facilitator family transporter